MHLSVVLDCLDPERLARFWASALGYEEVARDDVFIGLRPVDRHGRPQPTLVLQKVSEAKAGKNRMHLDVFSDDIDHDLERILALGATMLVAPHLEDDGGTLTVLADPEGNEFCLLSAPG